MFRLSKFTSRKALIIVHDLLATVAAIMASFYIRFEEAGLAARLDALLTMLPGFIAFAAIVYHIFHLYEGKWRFASLPDLVNIFRAVTVLAFSLLVLDYILVSPDLLGAFFFGKITIALYWCLQMLFLGGPRITYRYFRYTRTRQHATGRDSIPILVLRRGRRDADPRCGERCREEDLAGRCSFAVAGGPGSSDSRDSGAGRPRRSG